MRWNPGHADVLDANLFAEQGVVLQSAVQFRLQLDARVDTVGRPTAGVGDVNWAKLITCKMANLTQEGQARVRELPKTPIWRAWQGSKKLFESGFLKRTLNHRRFTS